MTPIEGTSYEIDDSLLKRVQEIAEKVSSLREKGSLSPEFLGRLRRFFRIKNIYHSNAIEGNELDVGETRLVVEQGLTLTGKSLKDQSEAKNLSAALGFLEELAKTDSTPFTEADLRQLHQLVLKDIGNPDDAGGYRTVPVEISGSDYKPPGPESVLSEMQEFCGWLAKASVPGGKWQNSDGILVAAAAHTWFVRIHPFIDGNGRVARLLLNLILMRYGYPIAIITREDRNRYYDSLEISQASDLTGVASLIAECVEESLEEYEAARHEQRGHEEWAESITSKFQKKELTRAENQYEVWWSAMDLLKSVFRQTLEELNKGPASAWFRDFGHLELEKYIALQSREPAKKTWFFQMNFKSGDRSVRYLFFFGYPSPPMRKQCREGASLVVSREEPAGSFYYEPLWKLTAPNVPSLTEIGYDSSREEFISHKGGIVTVSKIETICRDFFEDVVQKHFSGQ